MHCAHIYRAVTVVIKLCLFMIISSWNQVIFKSSHINSHDSLAYSEKAISSLLLRRHICLTGKCWEVFCSLLLLLLLLFLFLLLLQLYTALNTGLKTLSSSVSEPKIMSGQSKFLPCFFSVYSWSVHHFPDYSCRSQ